MKYTDSTKKEKSENILKEAIDRCHKRLKFHSNLGEGFIIPVVYAKNIVVYALLDNLGYNSYSNLE